jgi:hypothetical protein
MNLTTFFLCVELSFLNEVKKLGVSLTTKLTATLCSADQASQHPGAPPLAMETTISSMVYFFISGAAFNAKIYSLLL